MILFLIIIYCLITIIRSFDSFPNPISFVSPFGESHDPSIAKVNQTYYVFNTGGNITVSTATSLHGPWRRSNDALPKGSIINNPGRYGIWAPSVLLFDDVYYCFYCVSTYETQDSAIGLATSTEMETWVDHGTILSSQKDSLYNAIDPALVIDKATNTPYLSFGSFWNDIYEVQLTPKANTTAPGKSPFQISFNSTKYHSEEGSYIYYFENYYYLFYSNGECCNFNPLPKPGDEYKVYVGRSESVTGPFVDQEKVDLKDGGGSLVLGSHGEIYAPGGQSLYYDPDLSRTIIVYHYYTKTNNAVGRSTLGINYVNFIDGWPELSDS